MDNFLEFALIGTTASGKTDLANEIARDFDAIILSLDSLCVYKELDIISAKPTKEEISQISFVGIDEIYLNEHFNIGFFINLYKKAKDMAISKNKPLIITGGTSFYLKTMLEGLSEDVKECEYELDYDSLYDEILAYDSAYKILKNDKYRLRKYQSIKDHIKINNLTNNNGDLLKPSEFLANTKNEPIIKNLTIFDILLDKDYLRDKIKLRTEKMLKMGAIEECIFLQKKYGDVKPLSCIGAKECLEYHNNEYDYNELVYRINTHTAQLAKRQRTFNKKFKHLSDYHILNKASKDDIYRILNIKKQS